MYRIALQMTDTGNAVLEKLMLFNKSCWLEKVLWDPSWVLSAIHQYNSLTMIADDLSCLNWQCNCRISKKNCLTSFRIKCILRSNKIIAGKQWLDYYLFYSNLKQFWFQVKNCHFPTSFIPWEQTLCRVNLV